ncbi:coat protein [Sphaeropsis sapinea RNA virus 1]|uniref:Coat protein n=1 Tax=Sphaeropsis sapinea RNA virus 1 TaxID=73497 RepID=Q9YXE7_9VIRU|nr:coat protein [Sphaeropsis sapinea RNA virus 1]AAD11600.1 coat protein [Sphaeropsis sapinea RNA virus 1]
MPPISTAQWYHSLLLKSLFVNRFRQSSLFGGRVPLIPNTTIDGYITTHQHHTTPNFPMEHALRNAFLAAVIASPRGGTLLTAPTKKGKEKKAPLATYRRYRANIRTESTIAGNVDARVAGIQYEIGARYERVGEAFAPVPEEQVLFEAAYPSSAALAEDFVGFARKYSNFSATFAHSSLAGLVERVARTLGALTVFPSGTFDQDAIRGGRPLMIAALGTLDGPVNSLAGSVFIPRLVDSVISPDVFTILINAAAGEGSRVITDVLELDATTRRPIVPTLRDSSMLLPCVEALRILGANMAACDQGPLFAFALVRGLNAVLSLVGHTDEAGVTRDIFRVSGFDIPFGGIHFGLEPYAGLPAVASNAGADACCYVDALLMTSGALVAHCDPGQEYGGRWFPTVLQGTGPDTAEVRPGQSQEGTADMANRNRGLLASSMPRFAEHYARGLGRLFAIEGDARIVVNILSASARLLPDNCRHLRYPSVSPYFWVEPTSLLPPDFLGTAAELNGCGSLAMRGTSRTRQAWEDIERVGDEDVTFTGYNVAMPFARSSWFLIHWLNHPANGLGALRVRQLDPNGVIHPGPCADNPDVRDRVEASLPITDYLWVRGQSPFPAPGEFLNLTGTLGLLARHLTMDDDGIPTEEHLPTGREFRDTAVTVVAGRPVGLPNGAHNAYDSQARRARTRATRELAASAARARLYGRATVAEMPILTSAPVLRAAPPRPEAVNPMEGGGPGHDLARHSGMGRHTYPPDREQRGDPAVPVPQHQALRAPQMPRPGPNPQGGGVIPPPPPLPPSGGGDGSGPSSGGSCAQEDTNPAPPVAPGPAQPDGPANE